MVHDFQPCQLSMMPKKRIYSRGIRSGVTIALRSVKNVYSDSKIIPADDVCLYGKSMLNFDQSCRLHVGK